MNEEGAMTRQGKDATEDDGDRELIKERAWSQQEVKITEDALLASS